MHTTRILQMFRQATVRVLTTIAVAAVVASLASVASAAVAAPKIYVGNFKDNTVSVIDSATATVVATIPVAAGPHGMASAPDGRKIYVSGDASSQVSVIDAGTDRVINTIDVGKSPHGLAMLADGRTLLVGVYGEDRVAFVDTASQAVVASVAVPKPHTIAVRPDGKIAYVASQEPGKFALVVIDLETRSLLRQLPLDKPPRDLEFAFDGSALYYTMAGVSAVEVLNPKSDKVVAEIATGASPHIASYFRGAPAGTAVIQGPGELLLFNPATNTPLRSISVGKQPHWVAATANGQRVYVSNEGSNDVTVVDLATGQTSTIGVGTAPRKLVVQRVPMPMAQSGAKVSIANFAFTPSEIRIAAGDTVTWANDDGAPHGLAYKDGAKGEDLLLPGAKFVREFDQPGTYDYVCPVHPYMSGKVVVSAR